MTGYSFFNHRRISAFQPCPTITATNNLYFYDADRHLYVEELKRLQSLPDDFTLTGSHNRQHERVGRMVPPLMMKAVAQTICTEIFHV